MLRLRPISAAPPSTRLELMNVGVNYMREHMPSDARVHYALLDTGGIAPNVVQAHARVRYSIRARDLPGMNELVGRVSKIADGAALMTECRLEDRRHLLADRSDRQRWRQSWVGGYRAERNRLLEFIADNRIRHVVFLTTDDHQKPIQRTPLCGP